jgi:hypothetical protein
MQRVTLYAELYAFAAGWNVVPVSQRFGETRQAYGPRRVRVATNDRTAPIGLAVAGPSVRPSAFRVGGRFSVGQEVLELPA